MIGRAGVVETVGRAILGQLLLQIDGNAQQIAHGILVLDTIQAAKDDPPLSGLRSGIGGSHTGGKPSGQSLNVLRWRTRLSLGRHLAGLESVDHRGPMGAGGGVCEVGRQVIQPELPLGVVSTMTGDAMANQQRPELIVEALGVGRLLDTWRRRHDGRHVQQRQTDASPHSDPHAPPGHETSPPSTTCDRSRTTQRDL